MKMKNGNMKCSSYELIKMGSKIVKSFLLKLVLTFYFNISMCNKLEL